MQKLIQTNFVYRSNLAAKELQGSYLGRKPATAQTLRRFVHRNAIDCGFRLRLDSLTVTNHFQSQWISK